ncbi:MAG: sirohydrochlorin cobaltochelatase, partial [Bacteroidales bacterium]|nr:sirohydrochlorin cobaltochelatase [Bacteroidales bacterium]
MKKRFILSALVMALLTACTSTQDSSHNSDSQKNAIVAVHFGTSHSTTREKTIEAFNRLVEESFPNCDFFEAYTSEIIIKKLKKEGIEKFSPMELFQKLSNEGYTNIIVQSTNIIPGFEYQSLIDDAESVGDKFNSIEIGTPLLYDISDCETVASIIAERNPIKDKNHHIVFVGHGTQGPANALYSQIDYMLKSNHNSNYHVATIEG